MIKQDILPVILPEKKKAGRPKKVVDSDLKLPTFSDKYEQQLIEQLFKDEIAKRLQEKEDNEESPYFVNDEREVHGKRDGMWDVAFDDDIQYFDPELSYELTGYRPITMTQGLDFDQVAFREAAILYETKGSYTEFPPGGKPYNEYWKEQFRRCIEGHTVNGYRITGDNYFFLNFYRMQTILSDSDKAVSGRGQSFPSFLSKQYEFFHYVEICEYIGKDICMLKARGLGFSEMLASLGVRPFITTKGFRSVYTAAAANQLDPILDKCWSQLNWLAMNTNGGMKRLRQKIDNIKQKRASMIDTEGIEFGSLAEIEGIVADHPRKVRGGRTERLIYEEAGSNPNMVTSWIQGNALVELGGKKIGLRLAGGCVCADTKVWTKTGEYINIQDIKQDDGIIGFKNGQSNVETISYIQDEQYKPCVRINLIGGRYLECSEDHPILFRYKRSKRKVDDKTKRNHWYEYDWIAAKDVDKYTVSNAIMVCDKIDIFGDYTLFDARLIGMLIGDGSYGKDKTPRFSNCDDILNKYVESNYKTVFERGYKTNDGKNYKETRILNICQKLREVGIYGQTKLNKRLPEKYLNLSKKDASELLAGLWDTDGYINKKNGKMELCSSCRELLIEIQTLCYKFGIHGTICEHKPYIKEGILDKNSWFRFEVNDQRSILNFYNEIPILIEYKKESLLNVINTFDAVDTSVVGMRPMYVKSVEDIGVRRIYNLTADDSNTYLANNIITHNTGGDSGPNLAGLAKIFNSPTKYEVLPYKNFHSREGRAQFTGFFIPAHEFSLKPEYLDSRGVTDSVRFKEFYEARRKKLDGADLLDYCSEHCFTPDEALLRQGDNIFDSLVISDRLTQIRVHKMVTQPKQMALLWDRQPGDETSMNKVKASEHKNSKLLVIEPPMLDPDGQPFRNLYVAGIDSIDMGTKDSASDTDVSDFCIVIKRRQHGMESPKYVAIYKDRPSDIRAAYDMAMKLLVWYNCKALLEYTKISIQTYFTEKKKRNLFLARPQFAMPANSRRQKELIGIQATEPVIKHGLELIASHVNDYCYGIDFDEMLEQLLNYSYQDKRKFDIIAAMSIDCCRLL